MQSTRSLTGFSRPRTSHSRRAPQQPSQHPKAHHVPRHPPTATQDPFFVPHRSPRSARAHDRLSRPTDSSWRCMLRAERGLCRMPAGHPALYTHCSVEDVIMWKKYVRSSSRASFEGGRGDARGRRRLRSPHPPLHRRPRIRRMDTPLHHRHHPNMHHMKWH